MKAAHLEESLNRKMERLVLDLCQHDIGLPLALREFERKFLEVILHRYGGNRTRAARALGVHRNTLANKLQSHGL